MTESPRPTVIPLADAREPRFGGKATGLAKLMESGLSVPDGFVVSARPGAWEKAAVETAFARLEAAQVAVRSSATCEDGEVASAAGQFVTVLGVGNGADLAQAIDRCMTSLEDPDAAVYLRQVAPAQTSDGTMSVVVQEMIDSVVSGVLFTRDPLNQRPDTVLVEACEGQGEQLVSGHAQAEQVHYDRRTQQLDGEGAPSLLTKDQVHQLVRGALAAEAFFGCPLDLEWAIDPRGALHWLQARPITTTDLPSIDELDYVPTVPDPYFTRANVGEMMPGAATPLTISVFATAVDRAMHHLYRASGALERASRGDRFICTFSNHLFFNLSLVYQIVGRVAGTSPEALEISLLGRQADERPEMKRRSWLLRGLNLGRYGYYLLTHRRAMRRLERMAREPFSPDATTERTLYEAIDGYVAFYHQAMNLHMQVSAFSGALNGALKTMVEKGGLDKKQQQEAIGLLLRDIPGIKSAQIIDALEEIASEVHRARQRHAVTEPELLSWLQDAGRSGRAGALFSTFLANHGHRCVREVELREMPWQEDPAELTRSLWLMSEARPARTEASSSPAGAAPTDAVLERLMTEHPTLPRRALRQVTQLARGGVRKRETTKSLIIRISDRLRSAYRTLAQRLVERGLLSDTDLIFFFTHEEIAALVDAETDSPLPRRARHRRRLYPQQMSLRFPDFCRGIPRPSAAPRRSEQGAVYQGMPISPGRVRGRARVILSKEDAQGLAPGEIMVARFTDVGWTPYYGIAAGLVTEIGSSLSHGAVVAREYGLPLVSNIENVTLLLKTGDLLEMDGASGVLRLLSE